MICVLVKGGDCLLELSEVWYDIVINCIDVM